MSTPVSGAVSWNTPVTINSGDVVTATDLNNLNKDMAFLRAKPWTFAYMNSGASIAVASGTQAVIFTNATTTLVSSSSSVGTITLSSSAFVAPVTGLYRFTAQAIIDATATTSHFRLRAFGQSSSATSTWNGNWSDQSLTYNASSSISFVIPMGAGTPLGGALSVYFQVQTVSASANVLGTSTAPAGTAGGPASTPPQYNTWCMVEYLGTSTGAY